MNSRKILASIALALTFAGSAVAPGLNAEPQGSVFVETPGEALGYFGDEPNWPDGYTFAFYSHPTDNDYDAAGNAQTIDDDNGFNAHGTNVDHGDVFAARISTGNLALVGFFRDHNLLARFVADQVEDDPPLFGDFLVPGAPHAIWAWSGNWIDKNGDKYLTYEQDDTDIYVTTALTNDPGNDLGRTTGPQTLRTNDPDGVLGGATRDDQGTADPSDDTTLFGLSFRYNGAREWNSYEDQDIVGYVTPHVPWEYLLPTNTLGNEDGDAPDIGFSFVPESVDGRTEGRYTAPNSNADYLFIDNGVLQTTVFEYLHNAAASGSPNTRTHVPASHTSNDEGDGEGGDAFEDVDVYVLVNSAVEELYTDEVLTRLTAEDVDPDHPEVTVLNTLFPTDDDDDPTNALDDTIGPVEAQFLPSLVAPEPVTADVLAEGAGNAQVYFDINLVWSGATEGVLIAGDGPLFAHGTGFSYFGALGGTEDTPNPDDGTTQQGRNRAAKYAGVYGFLGIWTPSTRDRTDEVGWIGKPDDENGVDNYQGDDGTPGDVYDAGDNPNPHEYDAVENPEEWSPIARPNVPFGLIDAVLEPSIEDPDGAGGLPPDRYWASGALAGISGVYVFSDDDKDNPNDIEDPVFGDQQPESGDELVDFDDRNREGGTSFNPWNDVVYDLVTPNGGGPIGTGVGTINPDRFVTVGPIDLELLSPVTGGPVGPYASYQHILFPWSNGGLDVDGGLGFDVILTPEEFDIPYTDATGAELQTVGGVDDSKTIAAWAITDLI